jgi:hypothetical protein
VVGVQMRQQHPFDLVGLDPGGPQPGERTGATVDQHALLIAAAQQTRLESPAVPEGVSTTHEVQAWPGDSHALQF